MRTPATSFVPSERLHRWWLSVTALLLFDAIVRSEQYSRFPWVRLISSTDIEAIHEHSLPLTFLGPRHDSTRCSDGKHFRWQRLLLLVHLSHPV